MTKLSKIKLDSLKMLNITAFLLQKKMVLLQAVLKNKPIRKKTGDCYEIERRNVDLGIKIEDE